LIAGTLKVYTVDLESHELTQYGPFMQADCEYGYGPSLRWACHPINPDAAVGFGSTKVFVWNWSDFRETLLAER
jgi:hypothetical protein